MEDNSTIEWINLNSPFSFERSELLTSLVRNQITITNTGTGTVVFDQNVYLSDEYTINPIYTPRHVIRPNETIKIDSVGKAYLNIITNQKRIVLELKSAT